MGVVIKCLPPFRVLYSLPPGTDTVILIGGRGGAKTREASNFITFSATIKKKRCVVLRDEKELIRESILNEILLRYDSANANGHLSQFYDRLDTGIKDKSTSEMVIFTKGFRASTTDKKANLKSMSNIDLAAVEELEDVRDEEKWNVFADGIRKEGALILMILNTPDISHWVVRRYFTLERVQDGYYDIIPKQIPGLVVIKTSFEDNPYLPASVVERYRAYGDPSSHLFNPHYFLTAIKGYASTGRKGQIFSNWKPITNQEFNEIDARSIFGQDFGTSSPAALVEAKLVNNRLYLREQNYKPLTEKELGMMYCRLQLKDEVIIADCAEPMTIRRLRTGWQASELTPAELERYPQLLKGWNVYGAVKAKGSINSGIGKIMDMEVFVTEGSTNLWEEYAHYVWAMDKNGLPTDEPEDANNHLMDPTRYIVTGKGRFF
jgi:PBSX family phage terminase large subunit